MPQVGFEPMIPVFEQLKTMCLTLHSHWDWQLCNNTHVKTLQQPKDNDEFSKCVAVINK
jgi:hypothetical protein